MSYQKILVALDRTPASDRVFDYALDLAQRSHGQLRLVHSIPIKPYEDLGKLIDAGVGLQSPTRVQYEEELAHLQQVQAAQEWLEQLAAEALKQNIPTDFICETTDPGILICQLAEAWSADVVVVGSSGKKGLKKLFLGSVSNYVTNHASCQTIVVPNDSHIGVETFAHAS
jgi:nucleotide-binding universal stress UspA family protein